MSATPCIQSTRVKTDGTLYYITNFTSVNKISYQIINTCSTPVYSILRFINFNEIF